MFPANNLEKYFEELDRQSWTLIPIEQSFALKLQKSAQIKFNSNQFRAARLSQPEQSRADIRNDSIFWLDAKSDSLSEVDTAVLNEFETLTLLLKNYFRISLSECECHYAVYPAGHFYKKHRDITLTDNKRFFSFVVYLNDSWGSADGGHLVGYDLNKSIFNIPPVIGNMILFKSGLEHEVLKTNKTRYSLTGWIRH